HWEETGSPSAPAGYGQRLTFMSRHFHLLAAQRCERFACLTFRKVANWYCRVLRPGREVQQSLMHLERVADFDAIVELLRERGEGIGVLRRERGEPPHWHRHTGELSIAVPGGPIERW